MGTLSIRLLGSFSATRHGQPVHFGYDKQRALLAYLAVEGDRAHRRQRLAAMLWPDQDKRAALGNLSQALYKVREAINDRTASVPILLVTAQALQLNPEADVWIDTVEFTQAIDEGLARLHAGTAPSIDDMVHLSQAVGLYRGRFLDDLTVIDSPAFEEWLLVLAERYQRLAGQAIQALADGSEQRNQLDLALQYARRRLTLEPWHEESHRQIMRLHLAAGDRNAALAQYATCRQVLAAELAVEPAAATVSLHEQILNAGSTDSSTAGRSNVPAPLTPLIGRSDELAAVNARLADPACRLIALTGPGGSGKTRLAIEAAGQGMSQFAHGVTFVSLVSVDAADAIAPALAQALGFSLASHETAAVQLINYLRQRRMLLVLDNFEHLLDGMHLVNDILGAAPGVKVLITSRVRLNAPGEHVIRLAGLAIPQLQEEALATESIALSTYGSVSLFLYHVHRLQPDYCPTPGDLGAILRICRLVAGMPLAIMLASAWMDVLTPEEISARLEDAGHGAAGSGLALLETDSPGLPERQRSIRRVFDQTWSTLAPKEQRLLAALSIFRGGFSYEAARAVADATLRQIKGCADRSLLQRRPDGRYEIHELLRQFSFDRLVEQFDSEDAVRERHAVHYADEAYTLGKQLGSGDQLTAIKRLDEDADNLRSAWEWMIKRKRVDLVDRILDGIFAFYDWRGYLQLADSSCRMAITRLAGSWSESDRRLHARLLTWHGRILRRMGQFEEAKNLLSRGIAICNELDPSDADTGDALAKALTELGILDKDIDREKADRLYGQSLTLYRRADNLSGLANVLYRRGSLTADMGNYESAHRLLSESLALCNDLGDKRQSAAVLNEMAIVCAIQGRAKESEALGRRSAAIHEELGDIYRSAIDTLELGSRAAYAGEFKQAHALFSQCSAAFDDLGARLQRATSIHLMAWMNVNLGNLDEAEIQYRMAQRVYDEVGDERGQGMSDLGIGEVLLMRGDFSAAATYLERAAQRLRALKQEDEYAISLSILAFVQRACGDGEGARHSVREALATVQRIHAFAPAYMAVDVQALLLADAGHVERAIEYDALVMAHPYFGNSEFRRAMTGQAIKAYAAALAPERVHAAVQRGRARDIWDLVEELLAESGHPRHSSSDLCAAQAGVGEDVGG